MQALPHIATVSDRALLVEFEASRADATLVARMTTALLAARFDGLTNLHPASTSILVEFDSSAMPVEELQAKFLDLARHLDEVSPPVETTIDIPVCYDGDGAADLADVARLHDLDVEDVIRLHTGGVYHVEFLGFAPGFAYLRGLDARLVTPRLPTPRTHVAAGSVAIGGPYTGVYPRASPGGWRLIGRTPRQLFAADRMPPALLAAGNRVRFHRIAPAEFDTLASANQADIGVAIAPANSTGSLHVEEPGLSSTIQDAGRPGWAHAGVSASGTADAVALAVGNRLVGNDPGTAGIEMTLVGGRFVFETEAVIAITGADFQPRIAGRPAPMWQSFTVQPGDRLAFGAALQGARCILCVRGGIDVPRVLGSAATHVPSGLGGYQGRRLAHGDVLFLGSPPTTRPSHRAVDIDVRRRLYPNAPLRITARPEQHRFAPGTLSVFESEAWTVRDQSDRMGVRLRGPTLQPASNAEMPSEGVSWGALQVPPDGQPIILGVDHQTTGGYPTLGTVCRVDLHRLGQLRPRDTIRFRIVDLATARALDAEQARTLHLLLAELGR